MTYGTLPAPYVLLSLSAKDLSTVSVPGAILSTIEEKTGLDLHTMAAILGVSKSKYYDLLKLDQLEKESVDALADFSILWKNGVEAFDGDQTLLHEWLSMRNENLGGIKPITLLSTRIGRRELEGAFKRIEYSTYG